MADTRRTTRTYYSDEYLDRLRSRDLTIAWLKEDINNMKNQGIKLYVHYVHADTMKALTVKQQKYIRNGLREFCESQFPHPVKVQFKYEQKKDIYGPESLWVRVTKQGMGAKLKSTIAHMLELEFDTILNAAEIDIKD